LEGTGIKEKYPNIEMSYVGRKYSDVVKGIEIKRPIFKDKKEDDQKYFEIYQNGLGENNLIYTSVVLGDLINRCEDPELELYNALLVEEPEAHLHPQLQNRFFSYLNNIEDKGAQVFITSHSPTITAKTNLDKLIVLQKQEDKIAPFAFSKLTKDDFSPKNRDFLKKFLDVTKSQLFFANGVILVEGLAEALLLPTLAKVFLEIDLEAIGIEIVNINGVGFEHFAKLFNNKNEEKRMFSRCAILTDSDPTSEQEKSDRAQIAENLEGENLLVRFAKESFEFDLFKESDKNATLMREVYRDLHPLTEDLKSEFDVAILRKKLNKSFRDKGDFALALQAKLSGLAKDSFDVPEYIKEAVNWVVKKDKNV
jgi:putative ATP-dependent endonuclease of OLD family